MVGITTYGAYVPYNRLNRMRIKEEYGSVVPKGEKAVANYDEDSLTLAVNAALCCTKDYDISSLNAVYFASTTSPFAEKQASATLAAVLIPSAKLRTADFGNSLRAVSSAMLAAIDMAKSAGSVLVAAADCRLGKANGTNEAAFGDAAASFVFGNEHVIARILGTSSMVHDLPDVWRPAGEKFVRGWDEKYTTAKGFIPSVSQVIKEVLTSTGLQVNDFYKVIIASPRPRNRIEVATKLGFVAEQLQESYFETIGDSGTAQAPLMLVGALEDAKPGDKILFVTYGEGADAIVFEVTEEILQLAPRCGVANYLKHKRNTMSYGKYLRWKGLLEFEFPRRPNPTRGSVSAYNRNYEKNYRLSGSRCMVCGTIHFPPQRVCAKCDSVNDFELCSLLGVPAKLTTYTCDYLAYCEDPPVIASVIDFANGGRIMTALVDVEEQELKVGMELEMSFRKVNDAEGVKTYFWKAVPKRI
ncbi:MAG TPA: OB-fold domain-containing protein [Negativicutes bacterium]